MTGDTGHWSKTFQACATGAWHIAEILAVIAIGAWTYYQWEKTIFPKEHDEMQARLVDRLPFVSGNLECEYQIVDQSESSVLLQVDTWVICTGVGDVPVDVELKGARAYVGRFNLKDERRVSLKRWSWSEPVTIELDGLNPTTNEKHFLSTAYPLDGEPSVQIPLSFFYEIETQNADFLRFVLEVDLDVASIDPLTGEQIEKDEMTAQHEFLLNSCKTCTPLEEAPVQKNQTPRSPSI